MKVKQRLFLQIWIQQREKDLKETRDVEGFFFRAFNPTVSGFSYVLA